MIYFDIELNGEPYCRAGLDEFGVVSVNLHWMDFNGAAVTDERDNLASALSLSVHGFRSERAFTNEQALAGEEAPPMTAVHWKEVSKGLQAGDELRIRIVESDHGDADPPTETPMLPPSEGGDT